MTQNRNETTTPERFPERLRRLRLKSRPGYPNGMTLADMERETGLTRGHISHLETGRRGPGQMSVETARAIAAAFHISIEELTDEEA